MSSCGSNAGMETSAPLVNAISSITLCSTPTHTSVRRCLKSFTSWAFVEYTSVELCPRFCSQLDWGTAVRQSQVWKFIGVTTIS